MSIEAYWVDLRRIRLLSKEEQLELRVRMKNGDITARNKLVETCLRFSYAQALKFVGCGLELSDLTSEANIATTYAVEDWDPKISGLLAVVGKYIDSHLKKCFWKQGHNGVFVPLCTLEQVARLDKESIEDIVGSTRPPGWIKRRKQEILNAASVSRISPIAAIDYCEPQTERFRSYPIDWNNLDIIPEGKDIFDRWYGLNGYSSYTIREISKDTGVCIPTIKKVLLQIAAHCGLSGQSMKNPCIRAFKTQHQKVCPECKAAFPTPYKDKIYCSMRCKRKACHRKKDERKLQKA